MTIRTSLFCGTALAERIERFATAFLAATGGTRARRGDTVGFVRELAGGLASYAEPDSPFNKVAGLGFRGVPTDTELAEMEQAYAAVGAPIQVELSNLADPAVGEVLTGRGYRLIGYENVLGLALDGRSGPDAPSDVEIRRCRDEDAETVLDVMIEAILTPDVEGVPSTENFPRDVLGNAVRDMDATGARRYLALIDGVPVGTGAVRMAGGLAYFAGATTSPRYRRRGVQTALIAARLADVAAAGCDIATVTTAPGTKSQQNVQRRGFDLLYTRALLVKTP